MFEISDEKNQNILIGIFSMFSDNEIRKTKNKHLNIFCQDFNCLYVVHSCQFKANFLFFFILIAFELQTIVVS